MLQQEGGETSMARANEGQGLIDTWLRERGDPNVLLFEAARFGYLRALIFALDTAGASVNGKDKRGAVYRAAGAEWYDGVRDNGIKCIQALLERGATLSTDPDANPLHVACANGCQRTVAWLLRQPEANALMMAVNLHSNTTPFGIAAQWIHTRCMCLLIQHGYTPTEADLSRDRGGSARAIVANRHAYERFVVVMAIARFRKREAPLSVDMLRYVARLVWPGPWSKSNAASPSPLKRRK